MKQKLLENSKTKKFKNQKMTCTRRLYFYGATVTLNISALTIVTIGAVKNIIPMIFVGIGIIIMQIVLLGCLHLFGNKCAFDLEAWFANNRSDDRLDDRLDAEPLYVLTDSELMAESLSVKAFNKTSFY